METPINALQQTRQTVRSFQKGTVNAVEHHVRNRLVVNELVTNAVKHAFRNREKGQIEVRLLDREDSSSSLAATRRVE